MKIIHIVPTGNLNLIKDQEMGMFLTHLVERDPDYAWFAREFKGYKILDNSLIELGGSVSIDRVLAAAEIIKADEIILPDVFRDAPATLDAVFTAIADIEQRGLMGKYKLMAVCQGKDTEDFNHCFADLLDTDEIDVIGIPKVCAKMRPDGRSGFEDLWLPRCGKQIHLLGIWYSFTELKEYLVPSRIRSVDTCMAAYLVTYGLTNNGVRPDGFTIDLTKKVSGKQLQMCIAGVNHEFSN